MNTECNDKQLEFHGFGRRRVVGRFDGGKLSSDGGGLLLREVEQRCHVLKRLAGCFVDHREGERIEHSVEALIKQRVMGLALGYEDLNDHEVRLDGAIPQRLFWPAALITLGLRCGAGLRHGDGQPPGIQPGWDRQHR